jgi:hypothetical protein
MFAECSLTCIIQGYGFIHFKTAAAVQAALKRGKLKAAGFALQVLSVRSKQSPSQSFNPANVTPAASQSPVCVP